MKLLADVNVPRPYLLQLHAAGHDVRSVIDINRRLGDRAILLLALEAGELVLTEDRDYWRHIMDEARPTYGAIWIRLAKHPRLDRGTRLLGAIQAEQQHLIHRFTIIYPDRIERHAVPTPGSPPSP